MCLRGLRGFVLSGMMVLVTVLAGASTKLVMSWKNPNYAGKHFKKILVVGMSQNLAIRANFEDDLAAKLAKPGIEVIPGNTILLRPEGSKADLDYLRTQVRDNHIDAVVVSRLLKVDKKTTFVPGMPYMMPYPYYGSLYGYWGAVYPMVYSPDYLREDTTVRVETNFYAAVAPDGELAWTCISDTFDPKSAQKVVEGLVKTVAKAIQKEDVL
jgi:hypothetical protein